MSVYDGLFFTAIALLLLLALRIKKRLPDNVQYLDTGAAPTLESSEFKIKARPDKLHTQEDNKVCCTEFKHRKTGIYPSDRAQLIATAIAARGAGFDVRVGKLETSSGESYTVDLSANTAVLYAKIESSVNSVRLVQSGDKPVGKPTRSKCAMCSYKNECPFSAA